MRKFVVTKLSANFREAVCVRSARVPSPGDGELLVRNRFVGINSSDINYSAGRYDTSLQPPFDIGFEGIGEVADLGSSVGANYCVGQPVAYNQAGAFAEYVIVPTKKATPVPSTKPQFLPLLLSGATACISLQELGELSEGQKVLVTAAAGGTGQFAVQLAKAAGCHVVGTCSSEEKVRFLKSIGCDRPINYKSEDTGAVLRREYPEGMDVVYESVGGDMFQLAVNHLAVKGRLLVIGLISSYQSSFGLAGPSEGSLPLKLLQRSASLRGFFLPHYNSQYQGCLRRLLDMYEKGELVCQIDQGDQAPGGRFVGLESICRAVDYLYSGKNIGKIVAEVSQPDSAKL
ncbi:prostaglandin reductase-3-like [Carcharodon carcharias]|uniref:prostaglandin reductase-3-like n=1 Tax=Carcharodon carcharias TaxID=13397 RepID=UPI001B7DAB24|nr:prostaglandin reductase-3-like [Carcharodon carcharias]